MGEPLVVFVDVDDTLVRSVGTKRIPMPAVIEHVRTLTEAGATLYCWSTGGADYAKAAATELGIGDCFVGFLPKPNVIIDDQDVSNWRGCVEVGPLAVAGAGLEDHVRALSKRSTS
jgi:hypothetical protein